MKNILENYIINNNRKDDEQKVIEMREKIDLTEQANRKKKVLSAAAVAVIVSDTGD